MRGFLDRVWTNLVPEDPASLELGEPTDSETLYWLHRTIKAVTQDIERFSYNTALARLMELLNHIGKAEVRHRVVFEIFLKLLSPFAPHLCEEIWERLGNQDSIFKQSWPGYVEKYTFRDTVEYVVQINGKVRAKLEMEVDLTEAEIESRVLAEPNVQKWLEGKKIAKKIFVPNKLVNLVVK